MKSLAIRPAVLALALAVIPAPAQVTTSQYDNARTGATLNEKVLTPQNVNAKQFGKLGAFKVDGAVYAQPLFVPASRSPAKARTTFSSSPPNTTASTPSTPMSPTPRRCGKSACSTKPRNRSPSPKTMPQCPFIQPEIGITSYACHRHPAPERSTCSPAPGSPQGQRQRIFSSTCTRSPSPPESKNSAARNSSRHRCQAGAQAEPTARSTSILSTKTRAPRSPSPTTTSI